MKNPAAIRNRIGIKDKKLVEKMPDLEDISSNTPGQLKTAKGYNSNKKNETQISTIKEKEEQDSRDNIEMKENISKLGKDKTNSSNKIADGSNDNNLFSKDNFFEDKNVDTSIEVNKMKDKNESDMFNKNNEDSKLNNLNNEESEKDSIKRDINIFTSIKKDNNNEYNNNLIKKEPGNLFNQTFNFDQNNRNTMGSTTGLFNMVGNPNFMQNNSNQQNVNINNNANESVKNLVENIVKNIYMNNIPNNEKIKFINKDDLSKKVEELKEKIDTLEKERANDIKHFQEKEKDLNNTITKLENLLQSSDKWEIVSIEKQNKELLVKNNNLNRVINKLNDQLIEERKKYNNFVGELMILKQQLVNEISEIKNFKQTIGINTHKIESNILVNEDLSIKQSIKDLQNTNRSNILVEELENKEDELINKEISNKKLNIRIAPHLDAARKIAANAIKNKIQLKSTSPTNKDI